MPPSSSTGRSPVPTRTGDASTCQKFGKPGFGQVCRSCVGRFACCDAFNSSLNKFSILPFPQKFEPPESSTIKEVKHLHLGVSTKMRITDINALDAITDLFRVHNFESTDNGVTWNLWKYKTVGYGEKKLRHNITAAKVNMGNIQRLEISFPFLNVPLDKLKESAMYKYCTHKRISVKNHFKNVHLNRAGENRILSVTVNIPFTPKRVIRLTKFLTFWLPRMYVPWKRKNQK